MVIRRGSLTSLCVRSHISPRFEPRPSIETKSLTGLPTPPRPASLLSAGGACLGWVHGCTDPEAWSFRFTKRRHRSRVRVRAWGNEVVRIMRLRTLTRLNLGSIDSSAQSWFRLLLHLCEECRSRRLGRPRWIRMRGCHETAARLQVNGLCWMVTAKPPRCRDCQCWVVDAKGASAGLGETLGQHSWSADLRPRQASEPMQRSG